MACGRWLARWDDAFDALARSLGDRIPRTPPASALHGDLWSGNAMALDSGGAAIVDPAVYSGDRETDMAMTRLFGGFAPEFYSAYESSWPLEPGFDARRQVYNLYHLINHLNLFGTPYSGAIIETFRALGLKG